MPERFEIYIVYKRRYINTLPFLSYLVRLFLQCVECGVDLLVPVPTGVLDLLPQLVISHVDVRVIARPLHVRHVQPHLAFDVLHCLLDTRRKLLCAEYIYVSDVK